MCANQKLLNDVLRGQWGFDGYVTSDCGAITDITANHHFAPDGKTATAMGLKAGCDTDCGSVYGKNLIAAVNQSILSVATIDASLVRLAKIQMRLGLFEPKGGQVRPTSRQMICGCGRPRLPDGSVSRTSPLAKTERMHSLRS